MKRIFLLTTLILAAALGSEAKQARTGVILLTQPDGSTFRARLQGDAFGHVMTTEDGCAIRQGADGAWYYARFDGAGRSFPTEYRAGQPASQEVLRQSRDIPYFRIQERAAARKAPGRTAFRYEGVPVRKAGSKADGSKTRSGIILLGQFKNLAFTYTADDFDRIIHKAEKSAIAYFNAQYQGVYDFVFDIAGPYTAAKEYAYYGKQDSNDEDLAHEFIVETCRSAASDGIDFSKYDNDGDGEIDVVFVFFAGPDEADGNSEDYLWSHQWQIKDGADMNVTLSGKTLNSYACASERLVYEDYGIDRMNGPGTFCHEFSHALGLADMYDTDYSRSGGYANCFWEITGLMDGGNMNDMGDTPPNYSAVDRYCVGLGTAVPLQEGTCTLEPVNESNQYGIVRTSTPGEVFLFEYRRATGWDKYIGGSGLLVYHVDQSKSSAGSSYTYRRTLTAAERWTYNEVNCRPDRECAKLISATPGLKAKDSNGYSLDNAAQIFFPQSAYKSLSGTTHPDYACWNGDPVPVTLTDIVNNGSSVSFRVSGGSAVETPTATLEEKDIYQDAAIIRWSATVPADFEGKACLEYGPSNGSKMERIEVDPYESGHYACVIEGLIPRTAYKVNLYFQPDSGLKGSITSANFTTKSDYGKQAYIHLGSAERGADGLFADDSRIPLRVFNAVKAVSVDWTLDRKPVSVSGDGYYHLTRSGTLRAEVHYEDHTDVLVKVLTLKSDKQ